MYDGVEIDSPISKDKFCNERPEYLKRQGERGYWPGGGEQHKLSDEKVEEYTRYYYAMITKIYYNKLIAALWRAYCWFMAVS